MRKRAANVLKVTMAIVMVALGITALRIYTYGSSSSDVNVDAAVVLGAAVWSNQVSPVFRERINHALDLYRRGKVRKIIFTGGQGNRNELTESAAARDYAIYNGIPASDILIEQSSHTTYENVVNAKQVADRYGVKTGLFGSDPRSMERAGTTAHDAGPAANPSS